MTTSPAVYEASRRLLDAVRNVGGAAGAGSIVAGAQEGTRATSEQRLDVAGVFVALGDLARAVMEEQREEPVDLDAALERLIDKLQALELTDEDVEMVRLSAEAAVSQAAGSLYLGQASVWQALADLVELVQQEQ